MILKISLKTLALLNSIWCSWVDSAVEYVSERNSTGVFKLWAFALQWIKSNNKSVCNQVFFGKYLSSFFFLLRFYRASRSNTFEPKFSLIDTIYSCLNRVYYMKYTRPESKKKNVRTRTHKQPIKYWKTDLANGRRKIKKNKNR